MTYGVAVKSAPLFLYKPMNRNKISSILNQILPKLEKKFGRSKYYKVKLNYYVVEDHFSYSKKNDPEYNIHNESIKGIFDKEKVDGLINPWIEIYANNITSKEDLIKTTLHEYCHYLQSPCWMTRYYKMGYNYQTHPYELQADQFEDYWKEFI